ncbi:MAG: hypothetical protein JNM18_08145 [Planctomycetaceae bacterium]|nr:hypothetical protein [Planctomycetaceae bacterium]
MLKRLPTILLVLIFIRAYADGPMLFALIDIAIDRCADIARLAVKGRPPIAQEPQVDPHPVALRENVDRHAPVLRQIDETTAEFIRLADELIAKPKHPPQPQE